MRAMTRTNYNDNEIFDSVVRKLIIKKELKCVIDGGADIYCFSKVNGNEEVHDEEEINLTEQLENLAQLTSTVRDIRDQLKVIPQSASGAKASKKRLMM
jgi:endo-alpha-1,4-polygalactosaminidase (GH114 family)